MTTIQIKNEKYHVPEDLKTAIKSSHRNPKSWCKFYWYRDRTKHEIDKNLIKQDKVITSRLDYCKNTFYKISAMSAQDEYFDYFFKLKDNITKTVVKKNERFTNPRNLGGVCGRIRRKKKWKDVECYNRPYKYTDDGRIIVTFS